MADELRAGSSREAPDDEATTQADDDWPVAPQYQVLPEPDLELELGEECGAVTIAARPRRSGIHAAVAVPAVLALLLLAGAAAAWLVTQPAVSSSPPARSRGSQGTTPNNGGASPAAAAASTSTNTTESTTQTRSTTTTTTNAARTVVVPNVVRLEASEGARRLRNAKLAPTITSVTSSRPAGTVLTETPHAGVRVGAGSAVELRVAERAVPAKVSVPSVVGSTAATAKAELSSLGLHWSVTTSASSSPRGTVLAQSPSPGTRVATRVTIRLTVSSGPEQVSVPDVTGLDEASARAQLSDAGFDVVVKDQPTSDQTQDGTVVGQKPAGGSTAATGSTVTITVARLG